VGWQTPHIAAHVGGQTCEHHACRRCATPVDGEIVGGSAFWRPEPQPRLTPTNPTAFIPFRKSDPPSGGAYMSVRYNASVPSSDSAEVFSMSNVVSFDRQAREQFRQIAQQRRIAEHAVDNAKAQLHRWRRWSSTAATDSACLSTNCPHRYTDSTIRHYLASRSESAAPRGLRRETRVSKG
jgi:hypothetical protein